MGLFLCVVVAGLKVDGGSSNGEVVCSVEVVVLLQLAQLVCVLLGQLVAAYNLISSPACFVDCLDCSLFN